MIRNVHILIGISIGYEEWSILIFRDIPISRFNLIDSFSSVESLSLTSLFPRTLCRTLQIFLRIKRTALCVNPIARNICHDPHGSISYKNIRNSGKSEKRLRETIGKNATYLMLAKEIRERNPGKVWWGLLAGIIPATAIIFLRYNLLKPVDELV